MVFLSSVALVDLRDIAGSGRPLSRGFKGDGDNDHPFVWQGGSCMVKMTTERTRTGAERLSQVKATVFS